MASSRPQSGCLDSDVKSGGCSSWSRTATATTKLNSSTIDDELGKWFLKKDGGVRKQTKPSAKCIHESSRDKFIISNECDCYENERTVKGTQSRFCACARVWFLNRRSRIQRCGNWHRAFTNPFASSSINFGFALKLLRIKDQWYTILVKCQFVCNRDLSVLTSMPFDGTSSGGKCYGAGRRRLSFGSFQNGLENRERTEK